MRQGYTLRCPACPWERYSTDQAANDRAWRKHARERHGHTTRPRQDLNPDQLGLELDHQEDPR